MRDKGDDPAEALNAKKWSWFIVWVYRKRMDE